MLVFGLQQRSRSKLTLQAVFICANFKKKILAISAHFSDLHARLEAYMLNGQHNNVYVSS